VKIPITRPLFGEAERLALVKPLDTGWVVQGPFVQEFERKFAAFTGAPHAIATTSCTTALHIAVSALGVKPGDEVIVPAFTWIATPNVVEYMGATPVFCDVDLATFNIDVRQIEGLVTAKTVGIIPVHLFGLCADMDAVRQIAGRHGLWVLEDAACAFGARYRGCHAGTLGDVAAFSFHPRKAITTGEGGMLTTGREDLAAKAVALRDHGASKTDLARHTEAGGFLLADYELLGFNYRMTDFQGALGSAQMDRAGFVLDERRRCAAAYTDRLGGVGWLRLPHVPADYVHGYQAYVTLYQPERPSLANVDRQHARRNAIMARLEAEGISTRQGSHAPVLLGYYARKYGLRRDAFPGAVLADLLTLTLPMYAGMTDAELEYVCECLVRAGDA
jgi:perosamine synthetase